MMGGKCIYLKYSKKKTKNGGQEVEEKDSSFMMIMGMIMMLIPMTMIMMKGKRS